MSTHQGIGEESDTIIKVIYYWFKMKTIRSISSMKNGTVPKVPDYEDGTYSTQQKYKRVTKGSFGNKRNKDSCATSLELQKRIVELSFDYSRISVHFVTQTRSYV
ncbi:hypothetical protein ScPMuIL_008149 [Solemya velum]